MGVGETAPEVRKVEMGQWVSGSPWKAPDAFWMFLHQRGLKKG